jgi:hypothetical protein
LPYVRNKPSDLLFVANKPEVHFGRKTESNFPASLTMDGVVNGQMNFQLSYP